MSLKVRRNLVSAPDEICPLTECMSLLGGAWTPNLVWYLSASPRRFGELRGDLPRISAKVLTSRLRDLEAKGVVSRTVLPTSPPSVEYALTDLGAELVPVIRAIVRVGTKLKERHPQAWVPDARVARRSRGAVGEAKFPVVRGSGSGTTAPHDASKAATRPRPLPRPAARPRLR